jgi:hypothetical protein
MKLENPAEEKLAAIVLAAPVDSPAVADFTTPNIDAGCLTPDRADAIKAHFLALKTGDSRFDSLMAILPEAKRFAAENGATFYVIHAPIYVDEFEVGEHVFGIREACEIMFPKASWANTPGDPRLAWNIDASVDPNGEVFLTRVDDILREVGLTRPDVFRKINVHLTDQPAMTIGPAKD